VMVQTAGMFDKIPGSFTRLNLETGLRCHTVQMARALDQSKTLSR
jgi:hypothetical protein